MNNKLIVYMPDGSTKIFEDIKGVEQQDEHQVTFICEDTGLGLNSLMINLDLVIGFEIDGIDETEEDDDEDIDETEEEGEE